MLLDVDKIRIDCDTQPRSKIDTKLVAHYAQLMKDGSLFDPVTVHFDGVDYYLSSGFHRYHAQRKNKKTKIEVIVINGTLREAQFYSKSSNAKHGMPLSRADVRRNTIYFLVDEEYSITMNDLEVARHMNVTQPFVSKLRAELGKVPEKTVFTNKKGTVITRARKPPKQTSTVTATPVAKETVKPTEEEDNYDQKQEAIDSLVQENDKLRDQLAVGVADDKDHTAKLIEELRQENKLLKIEVKTLRNSRDTYQAENAQLKRQIASMQRKAA